MFWFEYTTFLVGVLSYFIGSSSGICSKPCFTMTPSNPLKTFEGDTFDIRWEFWSDKPLSSAQWKKYDSNGNVKDLIAEQHGGGSITYTLSYRDKVEVFDKVSLRMKNAKTSDAGWYGCELKFDGVSDVLRNKTQVLVGDDSSSGLKGSHGRHYYWIFVVVVCLLIVLVFVYIYLQRRKQQMFKRMRQSQRAAPNGNVVINMDNLDDAGDNYQVISPIGTNPESREWECPRENIVVVKVIGKGAFGLVAKGIVQIGEKREDTIVALKMLKKNSTEDDKKDFLAELQLMKKLDYHPNVISLYGCVTVEEPYLMIIEYVPFGDLLGHLRKSRGLKDTYFDDPDIKPRSSLTSKQLFSYSSQIANGMVYLSSRKVVHRDLAARNVLVSEGEVCKITDFGLARDVHQDNIYTRTTKNDVHLLHNALELDKRYRPNERIVSPHNSAVRNELENQLLDQDKGYPIRFVKRGVVRYYETKRKQYLQSLPENKEKAARQKADNKLRSRRKRGRLPVKWTAYESLLYGTCTTKSDVWSFGILLYELFTIGGSPYPKVEGKDLVNLLQEGYRMPRPKHVKQELYKLMMECWQEKPEGRPTFQDLRESLKKMTSAHNVYVRLDEYESKLYENLDDLQF